MSEQPRILEDLQQFTKPMTAALHMFFPKFDVCVYVWSVDILLARIQLLTPDGVRMSGVIALTKVDREQSTDTVASICAVKASKLYNETIQTLADMNTTLNECIPLSHELGKAIGNGSKT